MGDQKHSVPVENMKIQLEIVPEDEQQGDIADADELGRSIVDQLRGNGYTVRPAYTGKMGGPVFDVIVQSYHIIHDNQELLAAFFASITALLAFMSKHTRRGEKDKTQHPPTPIEIAFQTNDKNQPVIVKAPDIESAITLIESFKDTYFEETNKVVPPISANVKVRIPRKKRYSASNR